MDRDLLEQWLEQGLSLGQIARLAGRDRSTVGYWVAKHGLTSNGRAKHAAKGGISRDRLEALIETGATMREMAVELDVSQSTVQHWLKKFRLKTKNGVGRRSRITGRRLRSAPGFVPAMARPSSSWRDAAPTAASAADPRPWRGAGGRSSSSSSSKPAADASYVGARDASPPWSSTIWIRKRSRSDWPNAASPGRSKRSVGRPRSAFWCARTATPRSRLERRRCRYSSRRRSSRVSNFRVTRSCNPGWQTGNAAPC